MPLAVLFLAIFVVEPISGDGRGAVAAFLLIDLAAVCIHLYGTRESNWHRLDTVFLLGYCIVNFQWVALAWGTDFVPKHGFQARLLEQYGEQTLPLSSIGLLAWLMGNAVRLPVRTHSRVVLLHTRRLAFIFLVTVSAFAVTAGATFFRGDIYKYGANVLSHNMGRLPRYIWAILDIQALIVIAALYFLYKAPAMQEGSAVGRRRKPNRRTRRWLIHSLVVYVLVFAIAGERGQLISVFLAVTLVYSRNVRPIGLGLSLITAGLGAVLLTAMGILRSLRDGDVFHLDGSAGLWGMTNTLASSFVTLAEACALSDAGDRTFMGQYWISQLMGVIPFAQSILGPLHGLSEPEVSSATKFTTSIFGANPSSAVGTSLAADLYLNVGAVGLALFAFALGVWARLLHGWLRGQAGFGRFYCSVVFAAFSLYLSRSSLAVSVRPTLWGLLMIALILRVTVIRSMGAPGSLHGN